MQLGPGEQLACCLWLFIFSWLQLWVNRQWAEAHCCINSQQTGFLPAIGEASFEWCCSSFDSSRRHDWKHNYSWIVRSSKLWHNTQQEFLYQAFRVRVLGMIIQHAFSGNNAILCGCATLLQIILSYKAMQVHAFIEDLSVHHVSAGCQSAR